MKYIISPVPVEQTYGCGTIVADNPSFPPAGGVNAMDYCHGDGETDDTAHILAAITAAEGAPVYFPDNEYLLSGTGLVVPSGSTLVGESLTGAWLKGPLRYKSDSDFSFLKIGSDTLYSTKPYDDDGSYSYTTFTNCHFRGGGAPVDWRNQGVLMFGPHAAISYVTFTNCEVECNIGVDATMSGSTCYNCVSLWRTTTAGCNVDHITFDGCHIGVSNGVRTGSARAGMECTTSLADGWTYLTVTDCTFEVCDWDCIDLADGGTRYAGPATISGNLFLGAGANTYLWGHAIGIESPSGVVISGNAFYRASCGPIAFGSAYIHANGPDSQITGNKFYLESGAVAKRTNVEAFIFEGSNDYSTVLRNVSFTDNYVEDTTGMPYVFAVGCSDGLQITGNTFSMGAKTLTHVSSWEAGLDEPTDMVTTPNTYI